MAESLKAQSAKGFAWDFSGNLLRQGSTFIISIFLARILTPTEFGLIGMAMVFITVSQVFIDVGFASALIQRQDNTNLTYSSIFYLNLVLGVLLTLLFFLIAPLIGAFYKNQQITELVRWLSLIFIFNSLDIVQITILKKELNFKILTLRIFIATLVGGILGVIAAFFGLGVYSLVIQSISTAIISTVLLWSTSKWKPDLQFSMKEVKKLTGFSTYVFFDRILSSISNQLDVLAVGKALSPAMLGHYTRAVGLRNLVSSYSSASLTAVFFPVLSSLQNKDEEYRKVYFKVISVIAFLSYGITGVMCILGRDIVLFLFGDQWLPAVAIFQVLILMACNTPLNSMMVSAFMSKGKSKANFWVGILRKIIRLIPIVILFYRGIYAFTVAIVIVSYFITILNVIFLNAYTGLSPQKHFRKIFEGIIPLAIILLLFFYFDPQNFWTRMIWALGFCGFYFMSARLMKTEGLLFILDNISNIKNKFLVKIKK